MLPCNFRKVTFVENDYCKPVVINRCYEPFIPTFCEEKVVCKPVVECRPVYRKPVVVNRCYKAPKVVTHCDPCAKKSLLNKDGSFFVFVSKRTPYLQLLIDKAHSLGLTISGDGSVRVTGADITYAAEGNYISFGSSTRFDMNWIRNGSYVAENGYRPVYDMVYDWATILDALKEFAANKKNNVHFTTGGDKVAVHAGFTVINGVVKRNRFDEINVRMPVYSLNRALDYNITNLSIIRNW